MTLKELIVKFLDYNYVLYGTEKIYTTFLCLRCKVNDVFYSIDSVLDLIKIIFDENDLSKEVRREWLMLNEKEMVNPMKELLDTCNVRLGRTNWEIYSLENKRVTEETLYNLYGKMISINYIRDYLDKWQEDRIYVESERIMRRF